MHPTRIIMHNDGTATAAGPTHTVEGGLPSTQMADSGLYFMHRIGICEP